MRIKYILLILFFNFSLTVCALCQVADTAKLEDLEEEATYNIDDYFDSGSYLIYHCKKGSFMCVDEIGFKQCEKSRDTSFKKRSMSLTCAPLQKFDKQSLCRERQMEEIQRVQSKSTICNYPKN